MTDLAKRYAAISARVREADDVLKELKAEKDQIAGTLKEEMERLELQKFQLAGLGTFFIQSMFFPKVVGDPAQAIAWLDAQGPDVGQGIAPRTVSGSRLKDYLKDLIENDQPLPPTDVIESSSITYVKMLKAK